MKANNLTQSWHLLLFIVYLISSNALANNKQSSNSSITLENVSYGEHKNQILDFRKADVDSLAPLVIYIHGGGFTGGSHDKVNPRKVKRFLDAGIHHISIEYRFLKHANFPAQHEDVIRALQFIRSKAKEWGINKNKIAAYGGSAGGQLVAYLAWHDDFADVKSDDPISRESTRLIAVAPRAVQSTIDLSWWHENIPGYLKSFHKQFWQSDGEPKHNPEQSKLIKELSIINHISADDPPTFLSFSSSPGEPIPNKNKRKLKGWVTHHVNFGLALEKELKAKGVETHLKYPKNKAGFADDIEFLIHHLNK
ncbi:alpha/beta hydrolase [Thalassotalea crassostreae]|uniref:alpha/beta hydrolase n=1 Tax=Thalassotalea crassostreae TaxID=1763536 RepID=UPI0008397B6E|nr:alpha/beta hydrolase [Thalassotalea crassostreae]